MQSFKKRGDNQIMCLEILSIAFGEFADGAVVSVRTYLVSSARIGLSALCDLLRERDVIIWSDNRGAEYATAKGMRLSSKACECGTVSLPNVQAPRSSSIKTVWSMPSGSIWRCLMLRYGWHASPLMIISPTCRRERITLYCACCAQSEWSQFSITSFLMRSLGMLCPCWD